MIIEYILTAVASFGILTIIDYLKKFEAGMAELEVQKDTMYCPTCYNPHLENKRCESIKGGITKINSYYKRKRNATFGYTRQSK